MSPCSKLRTASAVHRHRASRRLSARKRPLQRHRPRPGIRGVTRRSRRPHCCGHASPQAKNRYIYRGGGIHAVPTSPVGLLRTPLLTFGGACRAMRGLLISSRGGRSEPTIAEFASRRFGAEVAERWSAPPSPASSPATFTSSAPTHVSPCYRILIASRSARSVERCGEFRP